MATSGWTTWCSMRQRWVEGEGEGEGEREGAWGASRTHVERGGEGREEMGVTGRKGSEEGQGARVKDGRVKRGGRRGRGSWTVGTEFGASRTLCDSLGPPEMEGRQKNSSIDSFVVHRCYTYQLLRV